jgi:hypothetical protein
MYRITTLCDWVDPAALDLDYLAKNSSPAAIALLAEKLEATPNPVFLKGNGALTGTPLLYNICQSLSGNRLSEAIALLSKLLLNNTNILDRHLWMGSDTIIQRLASNSTNAAV